MSAQTPESDARKRCGLARFLRVTCTSKPRQPRQAAGLGIKHKFLAVGKYPLGRQPPLGEEEGTAVDAKSGSGPIQQVAVVWFPPHTRRRKNGINTAFTRSMKKADTIGRIRNARGEGPKRSVTAVIVAMAVGVEPRVKPLKPAAITAAS